MSEEQIKDMILKQCLELTTNNDFRPPISAYDGVDIDDVVRTCKQLQDKITYLDLIKENQELKKHLKVPKACNLKTLEDYKSYYEDTTREQILEDTYIEYCAYVNLAHRYSELKKQLEEYQQELELVRCDLHNRTSERNGYYRNIEILENQQK